MKTRNINVVIEATNTGYSAYCKGIAVCTTGKTLAEVKSNIEEAVKLYFEGNRIIQNYQLNFIKPLNCEKVK